MPRCRCSSLVLPALQSPAISCAALQNSTKLLNVILFVLEDTSGVQGKEPFIFPHYLDANIIVLEIWYKQLSFHKDVSQKTV